MVQQISPQDLEKLRINGHEFTLLDVRQPKEHAFAAIEGSKLIPLNELAGRLEEVSAAPDSSIVVYCHHGVRSMTGAAILERAGFTKVYSLAGGIEAWSCEVDPAVPRY